MHNNIVSVIIPVYNVEEYLNRCISSVINQTYESLEIILVDDGSPDNCPQMCDDWMKKDERIRVIHKSNGGLSDARNAGLHIAKGEYIFFLDGDDYLNQRAIELLYNAIEKNKAELAICGIEYIYNDGTIIPAQTEITDAVFTKEMLFNKLQESYWWYYVMACNKLYSKRALENVYFPVGRIHEDQFVVHKVIDNCQKIVTIRDKLYFYVQREGSITNVKVSRKNIDDVYALLLRYDFYFKTGRAKLANDVFKLACNRFCALLSKMPVLELISSFKMLSEVNSKLKKIYLEVNTGKKGRLFDEFRFSNSFIIYKKIHSTVSRLGIRTKTRKAFTLFSLYFIIRECRRQSINNSAVVFISTPTHGNLGDHAIVYSQYQFMERLGLKKCVCEISKSDFYSVKKKLNWIIKPQDLIVIDGGGSIGTLWIEEEKNIRDIITGFPDNAIVIFPQTAFFEESAWGEQELMTSSRIFQSHDKLVVFCRDSQTFDLFQKHFKNVEAYYTPDTVMFLNLNVDAVEREGVCITLRNDKEKTVTDSFLRCVEDLLLSKRVPYSTVDTVENKLIDKATREQELMKKWRQFASSRFVITDRLHGMIFSAITGTPCVVLDNVSHKVKSGYEWIKNLPYIFYVETEEEAYSLINTLIGDCKPGKYDTSGFSQYQALIESVIKNKVEGK